MKNTFCGNCGTEILRQNKFCINCGSQIVYSNGNEGKDLTLTQSVAEETEERYQVLRRKLYLLFDFPGYLIVSINNNFVQYLTEANSYKLLFDLGSTNNIPHNKLSNVKAMMFEEVHGNLNKTLTVTYKDKIIEQIVNETKYIFEQVFDSPAIEPFIFEVHQDKLSNSHSENKSDTSKVSSGCVPLIIISLFIIGLIGYCNKSNTNSESRIPQEIVYNSSYDASVYQVENYVKDQYLKDPDSYQGISWSSVQVYNNPNYKYMVRHKFRAKNGFGGYVVENKLFYLDNDGNVVDVKDYKL